VSTKGSWHVKGLLFTEATQAWIEAERIKHPNLSAQEIIRNRLHEMAINDIRHATVLSGIAAQKKIRIDEDGN